MNLSRGTLRCPRCTGKGWIEDPAVEGRRMRERRQHAQLSLRRLAARGGLSAPYLSDAELGRRKWNTRLRSLYDSLKS